MGRSSDCLAPPGMDGEEKDIVAESGGWTDHLATYGLKPWDEDDNAEGQAIVEAQGDQARAEAGETVTAEVPYTEVSGVDDTVDESYGSYSDDSDDLDDPNHIDVEEQYEQGDEDDYAEADYNDGNDDYDYY